MFNQIIFYTAFALMLLFIFLAMWCKNIFRSLLSAICVFFLTAIFFFLLGSEYNAVIQFAIYGFAIPILLGIGIMFTNLKETDKKITKKDYKESKSAYISLLIGGIFILALIYIVMTSNLVIPDEFNIYLYDNSTLENHFDNLNIFSKGIFVRYVWAFELTALILTIITAGLVIISERRVR